MCSDYSLMNVLIPNVWEERDAWKNGNWDGALNMEWVGVGIETISRKWEQ